MGKMEVYSVQALYLVMALRTLLSAKKQELQRF
jgi:hypothetical protein